MPPSLERSHRWISCLVVVISLLGMVVTPKFWSGPRPEGVPYGVKPIPGIHFFGVQDFSCHVNYLHNIWNRSVGHPYRLKDQEQIARAWCPQNSMGFPHAYSPVTLVAAAPLLLLPAGWAFVCWTVINAGLLLTLTWAYLFRRMRNPTQGCALAAIFCSYLSLDIFNMGQTALATTCLYAAIYLLLQKRSAGGPALPGDDFLLSVLLYVLAFKPSIAVIGFSLAAGGRAWRPLILAGVGLALTWAALGPLYGGYVDGLKDYAWLLNHYYDIDMTPFFRGSLAPGVGTNFTSLVTQFAAAWNPEAFFLSRLIFGGLVVALTVLVISRRISFSTQFQGLVWTLLLFCPYLLVTEDIALCLLAVEGNFFRNGLGGAVKVALVFVAANIWIGALLGWPLSFIFKLALAIWWLLELILSPSYSEPDGEAAVASAERRG